MGISAPRVEQTAYLTIVASTSSSLKGADSAAPKNFNSLAATLFFAKTQACSNANIDTLRRNNRPRGSETGLEPDQLRRTHETVRAAFRFDDKSLAQKLESYSLEAIVEHKISRFLDQIGSFYPENLYALMMKKVEKPLLSQILYRTGGNQVQASKILGINRNTLRSKMKIYGLNKRYSK